MSFDKISGKYKCNSEFYCHRLSVFEMESTVKKQRNNFYIIVPTFISQNRRVFEVVVHIGGKDNFYKKVTERKPR